MDSISNDTTQMEINISNQNAKGQIVLNDHKLLELIVLYPFLYNPGASPYQDPDYDDWAWQKITTAFNELYRAYDLVTPFTAAQLKMRWEELKPIIATLVRAQDAIPMSLKRLIVNINLGSNTNCEKKNRAPSKVESLILENIPMVENLPLRERKRLEAEVMELLLNTELEAHGTVTLGPMEENTIEKEYNEFFQTISIKNLASLEKTESKQLSNDFITTDRGSDLPSIQLDEDTLMDDLQSGEEQLIDYNLNTDFANKISLEVNNGSVQLDFEEVDTNPPEQLLADVKPDMLTIERQQITEVICSSWKKQDDNTAALIQQQATCTARDVLTENREEADIDIKPNIIDLTNTQQKTDESKRSSRKIPSTKTKLLHDLASNPLVPIKNARKFVRNFRIRVKRLNLDDYIPLAQYKRTRLKSRR